MATLTYGSERYSMDHETAAVLRSITPSAEQSGDWSAVQAVILLGLHAGRIVRS